MGSILDQCANDAWDVIRGRRKKEDNWQYYYRRTRSV